MLLTRKRAREYEGGSEGDRYQRNRPMTARNDGTPKVANLTGDALLTSALNYINDKTLKKALSETANNLSIAALGPHNRW